jgi:hypothetical protein
MARNIKALEDLVWYIPDVDDNRSDPEPLRVQLQPMLAHDWRAVERGMGTPTGKKTNFVARAQAMMERVISSNVKAVENYSVGSKQITTGEELFKHGEKDVVEDVYRALSDISLLNDGAMGKFV